MDLPTPHLRVTDLYGRRMAKDAARLRAYNQILDSIHHRIRNVSQMPLSPCEVLYTIPPFILGLPKIDLEDCVVYLVHQLRTEGFEVRYTYPNLLFISWLHHEKSYILDQSPIMQAMLENSEAAAAAERSRFGRRGGGGGRKPRSLVGTGVPPPSFAPATNLRPPPAVSFAPPSVGRAPAASDYVPPSSFLQTMERPRPRPGPEPAPVIVPTAVGGGGGGGGAGAGGTSGGALDPIGGVLLDLWK